MRRTAAIQLQEEHLHIAKHLIASKKLALRQPRSEPRQKRIHTDTAGIYSDAQNTQEMYI